LRLALFESEETRRVSPQDTSDYRIFSERYRRTTDSNELETFERFYAARSLIENGLETYLDPLISGSDLASGTTVDACGVDNDSLTIVLCTMGRKDSSIRSILQQVNKSQNARAVILAPVPSNTRTIVELMPEASESRKATVEALGWFDDHLDRTLQETLRLIDLLGNETRMRMLTPLFRKTGAKRDYRASINPKLVYQNLSVLLDAGILDEEAGAYELSELGKTVMAEFISFLEKTRKALDSASKAKGVKHD
jgi:hypothetical protein